MALNLKQKQHLKYLCPRHVRRMILFMQNTCICSHRILSDSCFMMLPCRSIPFHFFSMSFPFPFPFFQLLYSIMVSPFLPRSLHIPSYCLSKLFLFLSMQFQIVFLSMSISCLSISFNIISTFVFDSMSWQGFSALLPAPFQFCPFLPISQNQRPGGAPKGLVFLFT